MCSLNNVDDADKWFTGQFRMTCVHTHMQSVAPPPTLLDSPCGQEHMQGMEGAVRLSDQV